MILFTVTTSRPMVFWKNEGHTHCVAICTTLEQAETLIIGNYGDMHEEMYEYVIIEETQADTTYPPPMKEWWFEWVDGKYIRIDKPTEFDQIVRFGI